MDKEKLKEQARVVMAKARAAMSEIKENFRADEGATGARKIQSRFVNLWKSGTPGRVVLIASPVAVLLLLVLVFGGSGSDRGVQSPVPSDKSVAQRPAPAEKPDAQNPAPAEKPDAQNPMPAEKPAAQSPVLAETPVAQSPARQDTLVVKGFYMRQSGDDALNVCKKIVASSEGLVVVDFRNGIEREKDDATKAKEWQAYEKEKQDYENAKRTYDRNISCLTSFFDLFLKWRNRYSKMYEDGKVQDIGPLQGIEYRDLKEFIGLPSMGKFANRYGYQIEWTLNPPNAMGIVPSSEYFYLQDVGQYPIRMNQINNNNGPHNKNSWFRLVLKNSNGADVAKEEGIKNWLAEQIDSSKQPQACPNPPSTKYKIDKKNVIKIAVKKPGMREDELPGLAFVWIDNNGNVKEVYFTEDGMDRLFNAGDVSGEEFARLLIKNYAGIPRLESMVNKESLREKAATIQITNSTWIYKDPKGYQVKIFERSAYYCSDDGTFSTKITRESAYTGALSIVDKAPQKFFTFFAITPEASRKFD